MDYKLKCPNSLLYHLSHHFFILDITNTATNNHVQGLDHGSYQKNCFVYKTSELRPPPPSYSLKWTKTLILTALAGNALTSTGVNPLNSPFGPLSLIISANTLRIPFLYVPSGATSNQCNRISVMYALITGTIRRNNKKYFNFSCWWNLSSLAGLM